MIALHFSPEIQAACPQLCVATVEAQVRNSEHDDLLWQEIHGEGQRLLTEYTPDSLKQRAGIEATRRVYRALGKDPSRYRPSNEALVRRLLQGKSLYEISTLVDLNNLASMHWAYSIGGFDMDKIQGTELTLGVGREGEPYEGIGRGLLNIADLPVYRDAVGGIGTPTSDHERTKIGLETTRLLFLINGYDGNQAATEGCARHLQELLRRYAHSDGGHMGLHRP
ncbi:MAG: hypothetical protein ILA34_07405 [Bacteroidaceae bacterium]|nr:hypothetical protein [Bacteroidaceae bacterium]